MTDPQYEAMDKQAQWDGQAVSIFFRENARSRVDVPLHCVIL